MNRVAKRRAAGAADEAAATRLAQARRHRGAEPATALALAQAALAAAQAQGDVAVAAASRLLCAEVLYDLSDYERASREGAAALAGFEALDEAAGRIDSLRVLGRIQEKLGHDEAAQARLQQALALSLQAREHQRAGYVLLSLGHVRHNAGDFTGELPLYRQALDIAEKLGDGRLQGMAESGLANAYARLGEYARALSYHQRCLQQFDEAQSPRERSFILNNIANVHFALEDHRSAIELHEQSLALKRRLNDRWGESTSLEGLGASHAALGDFDGAQGHFEASLAIARALGDREGACVGQQNLGDLALRRGRANQALQHYGEGLALARTLGRRYQEAMLLTGQGRAHRLLGERPQARDSLTQALGLTAELQVRREARQIHEELAALFEEDGDASQALAHLKQAHRLARELFGEDLESRLRHLKLNFELEKAEQEKELHRQRHAELAQVNQALEQANAQKEKLLAVLEKQKRQLQRQSTQDALTGLANRRRFDQELARLFRSSKRYGHPLSLVLCDIDNFKAINDRYSHQTGDAVLQAVARLLARHCRQSDLVARYGGEEFALLLSGTAGGQAFVACEKIRRVVAAHPWHRLQAGLQVTLSMGIADELAADTHAPLVALADQRLYQAKHAGKNRVVLGA